MIVFGFAPGTERLQLGDDIPIVLSAHVVEHLLDGGAIILIDVIHAGAVLAAAVVALLVHAGGIDDLEVLAHQRVQAHDLGVVRDAHGLRITGSVGAHFLVAGMGDVRVAVGVSGDGIGHAGNAREVFLHAPETASGEVDVMQVVVVDVHVCLLDRIGRIFG